MCLRGLNCNTPFTFQLGEQVVLLVVDPRGLEVFAKWAQVTKRDLDWAQ